LGQRSRKRGQRQRTPVAPSAPTEAPQVSRSEERNAAIRAGLTPLGPGERPWPIKVSALVATILALVNLGLFIAGAKPHVGGQQPRLPEILVFSGLMLACAGGMWWLRYWAVLGFQALLAIGLLGFSLALVRVSSLIWGAVCVIVIAAGGYLFFKLVRVLSRLQLPQVPGR